MKIIPPIEVEKLEDCFKNNEQGNYGFYPLSKNNFWHGGIHLYSDKPIRAVADGSLVAYRLSSDYIKVQNKDKTVELSNCFILLKHTYETPNKKPIVFYSLYMHLRPWNAYKQGDKYPEFTYESSYVVNTKEDGMGLNIRGEADKSQIVGVIPRDAVFKKLSDAPPSWTPPANDPDRYKKYKKVEYKGKVGFAFLDSSNCSAITSTMYRLSKTPSDAPIAGTEGLAIRQVDSSTPVIGVLPHGTQVHFENEADFKSQKNANGYYKLDPAKHGDMAGYLYCKGSRIKEERKPVKPTLDQIVKLSAPLTVKAGDILGLAGKWYGDNVIHFEIFSHTSDFLKNPKKDVSSRPIYCLKKSVKFKEETYEQPDPTLSYPANSILALLSNEKDCGKYPLVDARKVALQPVADVWVKRNQLSTYTSSDMSYKISASITKGYTSVSEAGEPDESSSVEILVSSGEFLRYLDQKRGDYRLVRAKLKAGQRVGYWIKKSEMQAIYKKPEYWTSAAIANVWKMNPEIPQFTKDLQYSLQADTEFSSSDVTKKEVFGQVWYGFKLPNSEKVGWVSSTDQNFKIKDPYNWELFFEVVKDVAPNGYCDCKTLIGKIEAASGGTKDNKLTAEEIKQAIQKPDIAAQLRRLIINDRTEWSAITDESMSKWSRFYKHYHPSVVKAEWIDFLKQFQWWDTVQPVLDPLLKPSNLWFFHPIAFLEHLGKFTTEPEWIIVAKKEIGQKEIKGEKHNSRILEYHQSTDLNENYASKDETAWCSSFVNWVMKQSGYEGTNKASALSWRSWGEKLKVAQYGCIGIIDYSYKGEKYIGSGHVGFVVGKDDTGIYLLGGNQSDSVKVSKFKTGGIEKYYTFVVPEGYISPKELGAYTEEADEVDFSQTR